VLVLELMHFAQELVDTTEIRRPGPQPLPKKEMDMAKMLVSTMEEPWSPETYENDYLNKLQRIIDAKVKAGGKSSTRQTATTSAGKVVDLMEALQQSLKAGGGKKKVSKPVTKRKAG
jgi:DNA end-binding protein Ku